jgi:hypothetical protein
LKPFLVCELTLLEPSFWKWRTRINTKNIGEPWFAGFTLKTVLNWDLYRNKCTLYIKIESLLKHYYMYSTLFIDIT